MSRRMRFDWHSSKNTNRCCSATRRRAVVHFSRPLRIEPLEDRRLLASVIVSNNLELVNGDTSSIANLIAGDGGDGISLREAILAANATAGEDEVTFAAALSGATITLGGTELQVTEALTIDARPLVENVTIDANQQSRIFDITAATGDFTLGGLTLTGGRTTADGSAGLGGAIRLATSGNLTLDQSTISGNSTAGNDVLGGGIFANGDVTLTQSTVSGNSTAGYGAGGGGIFAFGDVTLTQSTVSGNSTAGDYANGGGIFAFGDVTLTQSTVSGNSTTGYGTYGGGIRADNVTLTQSTVSGNSTTGRYQYQPGSVISAAGGGIWAYGTVTLTESTVSGNSTRGYGTYGGGIRAESATLTQSTVSGNSAVGYGAAGGGIFVHDSVTLTQSTLSGNSAADFAGVFALGGAIFARGDVTLTQSTLTDNHALGLGARGGGVFQQDRPNNFPISISGSIVAGNTAGGGGDDLVKDPDSTFTVNYSLIGTGITPTAGGNNAVTDNPQLGPLANNGGPTMTHALLFGSRSPAINGGDPSAVAGMGGVPEFDQRGSGFPRVLGGRIDIGAYEATVPNVGATLVIDTLSDQMDGDVGPGQLSLREALWLAWTDSDPQTIMFHPSLTSGGPATLALSLGELLVDSALTIQGPGANLLTIDGGDASRIFNIDDGTTAVIDEEIIGLMLTGGNVVSGSGGAIYNKENLTLSASTVSGNSASTFGGGIYNVIGNLTITGSTISGNEAFVGGGGIFTTGGDLQVTASTISGNRSLWFDGGGGGGIYAQFGPTTVTDSTLSGNMSQNHGGGIKQYGPAPLTVLNSAISGNTAYNNGGGIYSRSGQLAVRHSTITGNQALAMNNGGFDGGAGIWDASSPSELDHTIVAGNLGQSPFLDNDLHGGFSVRYSLIGRQTTDTFLMDNGGNLIGTPASPIDPQLGPLANNGGPTMTHALLSGSPAIDAGDPAALAGFMNVPLYDQRGAPFTRVFDGDNADGARIDMGAFELQPSGPELPGDYNEDNAVDAADYVLFRKYEGTSTPLANDVIGGVIGPAHYEQWTANFGQSLSAAGSGASDESQVEGQASRPADDGLRIADFGLRSGDSRESGGKRREPELIAADAQRWRDDALVAWLASRIDGRGRDRLAAEAIIGGEAISETTDFAFEAIGLSLGEFVPT